MWFLESSVLTKGNCRMFNLFYRFLFILLSVIVSGCEITNEHHGYVMPDMEQKLHIGRTTKDNVMESIGQPSCIMPFDPNTWYYLSQDIEQKACLRPKITKVLCYTLEFSAAGTLNKIYKSDKWHNIDISKEEIPLPSVHGREIYKQLLRNVGRFPCATTPNNN